ncbi:4-oxalocrotonate tautomerase [Intrasporangium chromatireducens Q5-1]|uniref:4-oxalocrotonate tautomerase n=1 Tax=Intrasporangium chromatireducens Q5-1 TaxID=584657 RepID=W9GS57_9MICO|nr:tautomerase family protein [Intrasporangium chromatireducens]EWT07648.1 4-oxalocrotonate tautomerase [Intrasporangium chromatireducens Q5-1]
MPLVEVTLTEGRAPEALRELIHRVHAAVESSLGANPQSIRVIVREVPRTHWAAGDQTLAERDAAQSAAAPAEPSTEHTTEHTTAPPSQEGD